MFVVLAFLMSSCEASTSVDVAVEEDGSGTVKVEVALDQAAAQGLLDLTGDTGLWLEDVSEAGWDISPPELGDDRVTRVGAMKVFGNPAQLSEILTEISGDAGLFQNFQLGRTKEFARVRYALDGTLHAPGIEALGDSALVTSLGMSIEEMLALYGGQNAEFPVVLKVQLPGHLDETVETNGSVVLDGDDVSRSWQITITGTQDVPVAIGSTTTGVTALVWRGVAVLAGVLALLVALGHLLRVLRPAGRRVRGKSAKPRPSAKAPRRRKTDPALDAPVLAPGESEASEPDSEAAQDDAPTVVALDAMGVLYREGSDITELLIPFAREMGATASDSTIRSKARQMSLGRLASAEMWAAIGVEGDSNELDDQYLSRHQLNPGVVHFLRELRGRGVRVACITNDSPAWTNKLTTRHSLEGLVDPWVVSGAVGVRKPDAPIFEVLRRVTGEPASSILVVDDELDNLDAARDLGFRTAWFAPAGDAAGARGHAILRSFSLDNGGE